jgi:hypothetical protein
MGDKMIKITREMVVDLVARIQSPIRSEQFMEVGNSHPALMAAGFEKVDSGYTVPIDGFHIQLRHRAATRGYPFGRAPESWCMFIGTERDHLASTGPVNWPELIALYEYAAKRAKEIEAKRRAGSMVRLRRLLGIKD